MLPHDVELFLPAAGGTEPLLAEEVTRLLGVAAQAGRELFDPHERYIYEGELEREEATLVHGD